MKVLILLVSILASSLADVSELLADGRYYHDSTGAYVHDDSGRYVHDDNPYIHDDRPYVHTPDQFGPNGPGGPIGSFGSNTAATNTVSRLYLPTIDNPNFASTNTVPTSIYLPIQPPLVNIRPQQARIIPAATQIRPVTFKPAPLPNVRGGGPYRWNLIVDGTHKVEHPDYTLHVNLPH